MSSRNGSRDQRSKGGNRSRAGRRRKCCCVRRRRWYSTAGGGRGNERSESLRSNGSRTCWRSVGRSIGRWGRASSTRNRLGNQRGNGLRSNRSRTSGQSVSRCVGGWGRVNGTRDCRRHNRSKGFRNNRCNGRSRASRHRVGGRICGRRLGCSALNGLRNHRSKSLRDRGHRVSITRGRVRGCVGGVRRIRGQRLLCGVATALVPAAVVRHLGSRDREGESRGICTRHRRGRIPRGVVRLTVGRIPSRGRVNGCILSWYVASSLHSVWRVALGPLTPSTMPGPMTVLRLARFSVRDCESDCGGVRSRHSSGCIPRTKSRLSIRSVSGGSRIYGGVFCLYIGRSDKGPWLATRRLGLLCRLGFLSGGDLRLAVRMLAARSTRVDGNSQGGCVSGRNHHGRVVCTSVAIAVGSRGIDSGVVGRDCADGLGGLRSCEKAVLAKI